MEIFNRLHWNLQKNILSFHRPYFFDDLLKYYISKHLQRDFSMDEYKFLTNNTPMEIIISEDYHFIDIYELFYDIIESIEKINRYKKILYLQNNIKILVHMNFTFCILNRIDNLSDSLQTTFMTSYLPTQNYINVFGVSTSIYVLYFFNEFEDLILDYDRYDWKEYGEIIYLFLNGEKDIMIHVEQKNIGVLFPVF